MSTNGQDDFDAVIDQENDLNVLKEAYYYFLVGLLDPSLCMKETHDLKIRTYSKPTHCDSCDGFLWGVFHQGYQCSKCKFNVHEKCKDVVNEDCAERRNKLLKCERESHKNSINGKISKPYAQYGVDNRIIQIKLSYPKYWEELKVLFDEISTDFNEDIKKIKADYSSKLIPVIKTKFKFNIICGKNLLAKDSNGFSDPYVTIQAGNSQVKRSKTKYKTLNPIWKETLEIECINTCENAYEDDDKEFVDRIILRIWDEDKGLGAKLDQLVIGEKDDFLGQIIINSSDIMYPEEKEYVLGKRTVEEKVQGTLVMSSECNFIVDCKNCNSKMSLPKYEFEEMYTSLHKFICKNVYLRNEKLDKKLDNWILQFVPTNHTTINKSLFKKDHYNLILRHFSNKYGIHDIYKYCCHFNNLYTYLIDTMLIDKIKLNTFDKRDSKVFAQVIEYMNTIVNHINCFHKYFDYNYSNKIQSCIEKLRNKSIRLRNSVFELYENVYMFPKIVSFIITNYLSTYCTNLKPYATLIEENNGSSEKINCQVSELSNMLNLFKNCCIFIQSMSLTNNPLIKYYEKEHGSRFSELSNTECYRLVSYNTEDQLNMILECLLISSKQFFNNLFGFDPVLHPGIFFNSETNAKDLVSISISQNKKSVANLIQVISETIPNILAYQENVFSRAFLEYFKKDTFISILVCFLLKCFNTEMETIINNDIELMMESQLENIKLHLNLFVFVKGFYNAYNISQLLKVFPPNREISILSFENVVKLFQPFIIKYLNTEDLNFTKYLDKIHDIEQLIDMAQEVSDNMDISQISISSNMNTSSNSMSMSIETLEKYYSPSVTDLFTIFYDLLKTVLNYETNDIEFNSIHQSVFLKIVKSKTLTYAVTLKTSYINYYKPKTVRAFSKLGFKKQKQNSQTKSFECNNEFLIVSCILLNNLYKMIEFTSELKPKLSNNCQVREDILANLDSLKNILNEDVNEILNVIYDEFDAIIMQAVKSVQYDLNKNRSESISNISFLIDKVLHDTLNGKLTLMRYILMDSLFSQLLEELFVTTVKSLENSIILTEEINELEAAYMNDIQNDMKKTSGGASSFIDIFSKITNYTNNTLLHRNIKNLRSLRQMQYKMIEDGMEYTVNFFSADESYLTKAYLKENKEYKNVLKTLNLYLNTGSELISMFITGQNVYQNHYNMKSYGKLNLIINIDRKVTDSKKISFKVMFNEARELKLIDKDNVNFNGPVLLKAYLLKPLDTNDKFNENIIKCKRVERSVFDKERYVFDESLTFNINLQNEKVKRKSENTQQLDNHELQIVAYQTLDKEYVFGVAVINLGELLKRISTIDEINLKSDISIDMWISLNSKLHFNKEGRKIMHVMRKHSYNNTINEFLHLKNLHRHFYFD